jgi:hypothetical protein
MEISSLTFPMDSVPYGFTYDEWTQKWWDWLLSIPKTENPALDSSGMYSDVNQTIRMVKFLCQTIEGSGEPATRITTLRCSQSILMPIINWISISPDDGLNDDDLLKTARQKMDVIKDLKISINGITFDRELEKLRSTSHCFNVVLPKNNIFDMAYGVHRAASDGYWLFLKPIEHDLAINTYGSCSRGETVISVNYKIRIVPTE